MDGSIQIDIYMHTETLSYGHACNPIHLPAIHMSCSQIETCIQMEVLTMSLTHVLGLPQRRSAKRNFRRCRMCGRLVYSCGKSGLLEKYPMPPGAIKRSFLCV